MGHFLRSPALATYKTTTLLVVEDNPDHLHLIALAVNKSMDGVQLVGVTSEEAALAYLAECIRTEQLLPRLILLDLYMPYRTDGIRALDSLKAFFRDMKRAIVPVVMFSYSDNADDIRTCYDRGANAYMIKSPDYREWLAYFEQLRTYWLETVTLPPV